MQILPRGFSGGSQMAGLYAWCDRFFWAVGPDFPQEILPENDGLILADAFGGEIIRLADETPLAPARRKVVSRDFARYAALRLLALRDPAP